MRFKLPPRKNNQDGEKRRVGFELEFGGMDLDEIADILRRMFDGNVSSLHPYTRQVETYLGKFSVEADSNFLKKKKYEKYLELVGLSPDDSALGQNLEGMVSQLAGTLIPFEVVTPPLAIDDLEPIEKIRQALMEHSARGTKSAFFTAFGMQFNPEVPDQTAPTLLRFIRAFFLLYDWLYEESEIPVARKVAPFIHAFPDTYISFALNPEYKPDLRTLIDDYLKHNPTRNRPLDFLPLFAHIDKDLVFSYPVERELVKSRPTFHYRLPNSMVDDPNWQIADEWNKWIEVEKLAGDEARIASMTRDYFAIRRENLMFVRSKWVSKTRDWLNG